MERNGGRGRKAKEKRKKSSKNRLTADQPWLTSYCRSWLNLYLAILVFGEAEAGYIEVYNWPGIAKWGTSTTSMIMAVQVAYNQADQREKSKVLLFGRLVILPFFPGNYYGE